MKKEFKMEEIDSGMLEWLMKIMTPVAKNDLDREVIESAVFAAISYFKPLKDEEKQRLAYLHNSTLQKAKEAETGRKNLKNMEEGRKKWIERKKQPSDIVLQNTLNRLRKQYPKLGRNGLTRALIDNFTVKLEGESKRLISKSTIDRRIRCGKLYIPPKILQ